MSIKLIASDLDGTLFTNKKEISAYTLQVLGKAMARGIYFVPSTGRAFQSVSANVFQIPGLRYIMCSNGAAVYSLPEGKRIYECRLSQESVERILEIPRADTVMMEAFIQGTPYTQRTYWEDPGRYGATAFGIGYVRSTRQPIDDWDAFLRDHKADFDSLCFVTKDPDQKQFLHQQLLAKVPDIFITSSLGHLMEVGHKDAGKGETLKRLLKKLDISPDEAMAFGDADNDKSMLQAVKYGIAMGNATDDLKSAAYEVTETNEEDGLARCVERYINL